MACQAAQLNVFDPAGSPPKNAGGNNVESQIFYQEFYQNSKNLLRFLYFCYFSRNNWLRSCLLIMIKMKHNICTNVFISTSTP